MDPEQTLTEAREAADDGRYGDAHEMLAAYHDWRSLGGYEPPRGDRRARAIRKSMGRQARAFEVTP